MYRHKNYVCENKVEYDEEGVIIIPTITTTDRAGGVRLAKGGGIKLESMLVPMADKDHEQTLKDYSKLVEAQPADNYEAKDIDLDMHFVIQFRLASFRPNSDPKCTSILPSVLYPVTLRMNSEADNYIKERYFLKANGKTWDSKQLFGAVGLLTAKKMKLETATQSQTAGTGQLIEPYTTFDMRPSLVNSARFMQLTISTNKQDTSGLTKFSKQILSQYDVYIPPLIRLSLGNNEWVKYNYGNELYNAGNNGNSPYSMSTLDFIFECIIQGRDSMPYMFYNWSLSKPTTLTSIHQFMRRDKRKTRGNNVVKFNMSQAYGSQGMYQSCYYLPKVYQYILKNSAIYKAFSNKIDLRLMTIAEIAEKTAGSSISSAAMKFYLKGDDSNRTELLRVTYNSTFILQDSDTDKSKWNDFFFYYIGDPITLKTGTTQTNEQRLKSMRNCARLKAVETVHNSSNLFKTKDDRQVFAKAIHLALNNQPVVEPNSISTTLRKDIFKYSWMTFQDVSPRNPSIHNTIKPFFHISEQLQKTNYK